MDAATRAFDAMIAAQRATDVVAGDHFAKAGANDRVWNALERLAVDAPDAFVAPAATDGLQLHLAPISVGAIMATCQQCFGRFLEVHVLALRGLSGSCPWA